MGSRVRVLLIEDGELEGTFYPLSRLRFDADCDWYVVRDASCAFPESLRELNISLDDIRSITDPTFPEFDEVRSWTPISTDEPLMENYAAFGPSENVALVVQLSEHDTVETMHFHIGYIDERSILPQIVELFLRIAARWELLLETLNTQQVITQDEAALTAYVNGLSGVAFGDQPCGLTATLSVGRSTSSKATEMGDSESGQPNRWQSLKQILKTYLLTESVIGVLALVLAATLFPGRFGMLFWILGQLWLMILGAVLVLIWILYALLLAWEFVLGRRYRRERRRSSSTPPRVNRGAAQHRSAAGFGIPAESP